MGMVKHGPGSPSNQLFAAQTIPLTSIHSSWSPPVGLPLSGLAAGSERGREASPDFFNQAPIGLVWLSAAGNILRANPAQLQLLGCLAGECVGQPFASFIAEPARGDELFRALAAGQAIRDFWLPLRDRSDSVRHVLVDAMAFWNGSRMQSVSLFVRDINERVRQETEILQVRRQERKRLAQDLHDGLGQLLVGAAYLADVVRQDLVTKSSEEAGKMVRILEVINEARAQARNLERGLLPLETKPNGLMTALRSLAARTKKIFPVRCRFHCRRPVLIPDITVATHLYRIAQEAVTNAVKHAAPAGICIRLAGTPGQVVLSVDDDGAGLPVRRRKSAGMGLRNMHYRAALMGGLLVIQNAAKGGTAVICTVPLNGKNLSKRKPGSTLN